jgi:ATP-dependent Clp protease ATP-binding subunit ClpA
MWQRFTERARKVVFHAQEEAQKYGEGFVSTEHLLLGLLREPGSVAARVLDGLGVSLHRIRTEVERELPRDVTRQRQEMTLSPAAKLVIDLAYDEARNLKSSHIGTEHLLLGLIREGGGLAGRALARLGVELDWARRQVVSLQGDPAETEPGGSSRGPTASGGAAETAQTSRMWHRFTKRARQAVFAAQEEAQRFGEGFVATEHLLVGLAREPDCVAALVLDRLGVSLNRILTEVEKELPRGKARQTKEMTLTPRVKRVIDLAYEEARYLGDRHVGTGHLLLGLIREGDGLAWRVLARLDVKLESVRREVVSLRDAA